MADLTVTAAQVAPVFPDDARIRSYIAAVAITAGQAVYRTSAGKADLADANGSGTLQFRGIALESVAAGQPVSVIEDGEVYGFTLSGVAYDGKVYVSNTAGALADAAGGSTIVAGRCNNLTDGSLTKVLYVRAQYLVDWS